MVNLTQECSMIDIGNEIKKELKRQERSVSWFARKLYCDRSNIYSIFKRKSLDSDLLWRISRILEHDFFKEYSESLEEDIRESKIRPTSND